MKNKNLLFLAASLVLVSCNPFSEWGNEQKNITIHLNNSTPDPYFIWDGDSTDARGALIEAHSKRTIKRRLNVENTFLGLTGQVPYSIIDSLKVNIAYPSGRIIFSNWMYFNKEWISDTTTIDILWYGDILTSQ